MPTALDLSQELAKAPLITGKYDFYPAGKPIVEWLTVKSLSSIYYVLASKYRLKNNLEYLFLTNDNGYLCEEVSSNIILLKGESIVIPSLQEGGVNGATQRYLMDNYGFQIEEKELKPEDLNNYDAIYLTRSSFGIFRIK